MSKTKIAIGCLVQWYEVDIINEYFQSLYDAVIEYNGDVKIDILLSINQDLEKAEDDEKLEYCIRTIQYAASKYKFSINMTEDLVSIADYRRMFNETYCDITDILVWGESDMLVPKQMFSVLDMLHQNVNTPKYIATFGICKMWDESWKSLEHPEFTNHLHSDSKSDWWSVNYDMTINEMNLFNDKVENFEVTQISPHKFNGCGLVISSEVIRSGVNIPKSVFFVHEDTALMLMIRKVLGDIPQYHLRNVLVVHNRKHRNKRNFIHGESGETIGQKRGSNKWYTVANNMCEQNAYNIFNPDWKSFRWEDVWKSI